MRRWRLGSRGWRRAGPRLSSGDDGVQVPQSTAAAMTAWTWVGLSLSCLQVGDAGGIDDVGVHGRPDGAPGGQPAATGGHCR